MEIVKEPKKKNLSVVGPTVSTTPKTHKEKMIYKEKRRQMWRKSTPEPLVLANLSKNHPHYGMSPAEHLRAKGNPCAEILV